MKSKPTGSGEVGLPSQYNSAHDDAKGGSFLLAHQQLGALVLGTLPSNGQVIPIVVNGTTITVTAVSVIGSTANNILIPGTAAAFAANVLNFVRRPDLTTANQVAATSANQQLLQYVGWSLPVGGTTITPYSLNKNVNGASSPLTSFNITGITVTSATWTAQTMQLYIEEGAYYIGTTRVLFLGSSTPTFTAPVSNPRIDLVTADSSGTIAIVGGTENASPVAPSYPANKIVLAEIYHVVSETAIYDNEYQQSGQGYVLNDVRTFLAQAGYISSSSQIAANIVIPWISSPAQGDIMYYSGSAWVRLPAGTSGYFLQTQGASANPAWAVGIPNSFAPIGGTGTVIQDATNVESQTGTTPVKKKTLTCAVAGFYTFNVNLESVTGSAPADAALYQNGSSVATVSTGSFSYGRQSFGTFYANIGDTFDLYLYVGSGAGGSSQTNSFQVTSNMGLILFVGATPMGIAANAGNVGTPPTSNFTITLN
jgi:hypothetical protein